MPRRKLILNKSTHHIYSKSISKYVIYSCEEEYKHMKDLMYFYSYAGQSLSFSKYQRVSIVQKRGLKNSIAEDSKNWTKLIDIIAYCLMPTHYHYLIKQLEENGIQLALGRALNAYTRYFNLRHNRKGPLWQDRFGNTPIEDDKHFQTAFAYVINNPVKGGLVKLPEDWPHLYPTPGVA